MLLLALTLGAPVWAAPLHEAPAELPWSRVAEWSFPNATFDGNPFDLEATATFTHEDGHTVTTDLFFAGAGRWAMRFAATRLGAWTFRTDSADPDLDGLQGELTVTPGPSDAKGFLRSVDGWLVAARDDGARDAALPYNVYMSSIDVFDHLASMPDDTQARREHLDVLLDDAAVYGFPSLLVRVYNRWFDYDSLGHGDHESEEPDPRTFEALESLILRAHERGMFVHLWAWGDEQRGWTPSGVGGINGEADRRLQRYIAARLGPLPGWTMSYGFDLEEWVEPAQVESWAAHLRERAGWPLILTARELGEHEGYTLRLEERRLDLYSTDDRPTDGFYQLARERLARGLPVLFERRFLHGRDGVWDAETTRRALWQFTMAGSAGAIWGMDFDDPEPYPHPERLRIHARFWQERFGPDLEPVEGFGLGHGLRTPGGDRFIFYVEDAERLVLALDGLDRPREAVAVDLLAPRYQEIELGELEPGTLQWHAPRRSDWAIAVGDP